MRHNDVEAHFIGFKFDEDITCLYLGETLCYCNCRSQPCLQNKREVRIVIFPIKTMRHSVVDMFLSVVSYMLLCFSCYYYRMYLISVITINLCLRLRVGDKASIKIVNASLSAWLLDTSLWGINLVNFNLPYVYFGFIPFEAHAVEFS